ncbi:MAG: serine hydrolase domain-containing protein [Pseudomonadota bacterium]|nr:serine hydrolase domain-containing protein [Pseudomonadota bacterium]
MTRLRLSVATVLTALVGLAFAAPALLPDLSGATAAHVTPLAKPPAPAPAPEAPDTVTPVAARPAFDPQRLDQVVSVWADAHNQRNVTIAVLREGEVIASIGLGLGRSTLAQPVASLSKAITAMCLNEVLLRHDLRWTATLRDLRRAFERFGISPAPHTLDLTLAQLATHTSGLSPDITQARMSSAQWPGSGTHLTFATQALRAAPATDHPGDYFYSNTNYAVLGTVIEVLENRPYGEVCAEAVLAPAGVETARLDGRVGSMSSFAGWEISAPDYARFFAHWYGADQPWMLHPEAFPHGANGYGLGVFTTRAGDVTHDGMLCSNAPRQNFGATVRRLADGTVYVATWQGCLDQRAYRLLDRAVQAVL